MNTPGGSLNLAQKLNQVVYPNQITNSPFVSGMGVKSNGSGANSKANTPISQMMELRSWQSQKINQTIMGDECSNNILSKELLRILEIEDRHARVNLST
jgi:hypothetical protein